MSDLDGRVCIVTGSTRGLGRAIVGRFHAEGAQVVVSGRGQEDCDSVAKELGDRALPVACDVSSSDAVNALVARTLDAWGRVDVLVNNAGIAADHFLTRVTDEEWDHTLATNLSGPFYAIRAVVPAMKEQNSGSVINVLSWSGLRGNVGQAAYSASKAGLYGLTLSAAKELAKFGVRVNGLSPMAPTDIGVEMPEELRKKALSRVPLHRAGTLDEVSEAALFLASDRSSFTTGQVLNVDGGLHLN